MVADPPMTVAHRLLDAILVEPGVEPLETLLLWLLEASPLPQGAEIPRTRRLAVLAGALQEHPRHTELLQRIRDRWTHGSAVRLLAETGLPVHTTILKEGLERVVDGLVPRLAAEDDLHILLSQLPLTLADVAWVRGLDAAALAPWRPLIAIGEPILCEAAGLLAPRVAALGLGRDLLELFPERRESGSPFFRLTGVVERLGAEPVSAARWDEWAACHRTCRLTLTESHERLNLRGVSTDLIFRLELLEAGLARLALLLAAATRRVEGRVLADALLEASVRQQGIRSLTRNTLKRLARKVTEHTAETGEHYQVVTEKDWDATSWSAAGGGAITAFTALAKYGIGAMPLSPLFSGVAYALNYSTSFVAMQLAHFTLASKQPAMTGAALAQALEYRDDPAVEVELVARITRSQMAATLGNVLTTIPISAGFVALGWWLTGTPLLTAETAEHTLHGVHPFLSATIPFAILTGVLLWLASLAAGWAANWSAYRGLPEAIARHRGLRRALGAERAAVLGGLTRQHLSGVVGYLALGALLGFLPVAFQFAGIPVEVRHVTLHAASLALAAGSLYGSELFRWGDVAWGLAGIVVIAAANLSVSFGLALRTAMRARDLATAERSRLWLAIRGAIRSDPRRFLWRPRGEPATPGS
jgi:site-specific recombinase